MISLHIQEIWRISGMGEPDGLPSVGSHRVGHNWSDLAAAVGRTCMRENGEEARRVVITMQVSCGREKEREAWRLGSKCFRPWCSLMNTSVKPAGLSEPAVILSGEPSMSQQPVALVFLLHSVTGWEQLLGIVESLVKLVLRAQQLRSLVSYAPCSWRYGATHKVTTIAWNPWGIWGSRNGSLLFL